MNKPLNAEKIAENLIELRGDKTREKVANDLGASFSSIVAYETAKRIPRDEMKIKIANYYNKSVGEIFFNQ